MRFAMFVAMGLAASLAGAAGAQAPDWSRAQPITVRLSNFRFTPSTLVLQRGTAYRLHLVNAASGGHDFAAAQFFADSDIAPDDRPRIEKGRVALAGGGSADIRLVPRVAGTYRLHCSHFMHSTFGMTGSITVR